MRDSDSSLRMILVSIQQGVGVRPNFAVSVCLDELSVSLMKSFLSFFAGEVR